MNKYILLLVSFLVGGCLGHRSAYLGECFLGVPYQESPLGEGVLPDADPVIRFDAFDCVTFVETVLADCDENKLNHIRPHGKAFRCCKNPLPRD